LDINLNPGETNKNSSISPIFRTTVTNPLLILVAAPTENFKKGPQKNLTTTWQSPVFASENKAAGNCSDFGLKVVLTVDTYISPRNDNYRCFRSV